MMYCYRRKSICIEACVLLSPLIKQYWGKAPLCPSVCVLMFANSRSNPWLKDTYQADNIGYIMGLRTEGRMLSFSYTSLDGFLFYSKHYFHSQK